MAYEPDTWSLGDRTFTSRFILGSGKFNLDLVEAAVRDAGAEIVTLAVRRANTGQDGSILDAIPEGVTLLPNTSGARTADEAVRIARLARAMGCGDFVKVEVIRDAAYLMPDNAETVRATAQLAEEGFVVLPYMFPDLVCARDLVRAGAAAVMPLAAPIGSNKGLAARDFIKIIVDEVDVPVIVDAGIGRPLPGVRGHGAGRGRGHGEHRGGHGGRRPPHGGRVQTRRGGGARGIPSRHGARARPRRGLVAPHRVPRGLGGAMTQAGTRSATPSAVPRFTRLEAVNPADVARDRGIDPMAYLPDMDVTDSPVLDELLARAAAFDFDAATEADVRAALAADRLSPEGFGALLSPAAEPLLEELAAAARRARRRWFGSTAYLFTPLYLANYCDNHCVYCGFNRDNDICRARLDRAGIAAELDAIAATGLEEILLLTGEDRERTDPAYIGEACKLAAERFRMVGVEVYPMNEDEYAYLHGCGVDYVTVFQETYDPALYGKLHLAGRKRVFPYRANAQERAMRGGMRGAAFGALLGLGDFRRDAYACGLHAWLVQRAYPHAELSLSCPRLRPIAGNGSLGPRGVGERQLLQVMCAYRLLLPQAGITISSRERAGFRDRAMGIAATKISAGVSTGVGEHADGSPAGDDQFEIADGRDVAQVRAALRGVGLEPVMNDYVRL